MHYGAQIAIVLAIQVQGDRGPGASCLHVNAPLRCEPAVQLAPYLRAISCPRASDALDVASSIDAMGRPLALTVMSRHFACAAVLAQNRQTSAQAASLPIGDFMSPPK